MADGRLFTVEGLDGAGKSTLVAGLAAALAERGTPVEVLREPGWSGRSWPTRR
jgi:thymidylate kinase